MPKPPERRAKIPSGTSLVDEPDYRVPIANDGSKKKPEPHVDEVDRALAVLHDRHPDALRVERATQKALEARKVATDQANPLRVRAAYVGRSPFQYPKISASKCRPQRLSHHVTTTED